jgi:hypothetical protein
MLSLLDMFKLDPKDRKGPGYAAAFEEANVLELLIIARDKIKVHKSD